MSSKFTYQNLTITVDFKTDFSLSMTASDIYTGDRFINESIELTKIKKDTIVAVLSRKNEKNLRCQFSVVDVEPKKLIISFIVSFDFLPTFSEEITLDQITNIGGNGLNKVESAELKSDIQELQRLVENLSANASDYTIESTQTFSPSGELTQKQLSRGTYLFQISGLYVPTGGAVAKNDLVFTIQVDDEQHELVFCTHINGGYGYPYILRKDIVISRDGIVRISVDNKQKTPMTLNGNIITIRPSLRIVP